MSARIRLVVIDDHALFRRGLIGLLRDMPEFSVVGEASDGEEALQVIERTHPDVLLLDVNMPRHGWYPAGAGPAPGKERGAHSHADHFARR